MFLQSWISGIINVLTINSLAFVLKMYVTDPETVKKEKKLRMF